MKIEEKRILEALEIIKGVCECNDCKECPLGYLRTDDNGNEIVGCKIKRVTPCQWLINESVGTWRALL